MSFNLPSARFSFTSILLFFSAVLAAQDNKVNNIFENYLNEIVLGILGVTVLLVLFVVYMVADKLLKISSEKAKKDAGQESEDESPSILPSFDEVLPKNNDYPHLNGAQVIKLKKGHDIKIRGRAIKEVSEDYFPSSYAVKPKDFVEMIPIPKLAVEVGAEVKAGDHIYFDKRRPEIFYTAPVSGEVAEVIRGEKRSINEIVILADKEVKFREFEKADPNTLDKKTITEKLLDSGCWPFIKQRPFNFVADPEEKPKAIFISGFDTAPLSANLNFTLQGESKAFQAGIDALRKLTDGKVHLSLDAKRKPCDTFENVQNIEKHYFEGPHPAGNVGIQIHHIDPIAKGEIAWTVGAQEVVFIGRLFLEGRFNTQKLVAVAGPKVKNPSYIRTFPGANLEELINKQVDEENVRIISGDVLTGKKVVSKGFLGLFNNLISVIEEGDQYEMFGWLIPSYARPSISPTFPWTLFPNEEFDVNTNTHGEARALVVTGQYEQVLPMNIYPVHLLKAIMANDFELMEGLGIYEVVEEDMALCEFVCTSKTNVQEILREGLDYMYEQS
ncbi:MAG: Na(+)-translocating NADH-quinone reductase subunit A [Chitinophagales bacterium]